MWGQKLLPDHALPTIQYLEEGMDCNVIDTYACFWYTALHVHMYVCHNLFFSFLVQRKPRDTSVIQKLQAVHSLRQPAQQQAAVAVKPTITLTTSQAAAVGGAIAGMGGAVAMATTTAGGGGEATAQKAAQIVQGAFPQGSILVVPHPTHPFHAVLPVFANTAVLMPQAAATAGTVSTTTGTASVAAGEAQGSAVINKKTPNTTTAGESETAKAPPSAVASSVAPQTILVQTSPSSQSLTATLQQASPSTVIQLSGNRNDVAMIAGASASEKMKETSSGKEQSSATVIPNQQSQQAAEAHLQQAQKAGIAAALSSPQTATIALHPSLIPQALATGMITATPGGGIKFQDYRQTLALSGIPMIPVMPVKVGEPVKLSTIDFESQSIEITGEVPIKKLEIDTETGKVVRETLLSASSEPTTKQRTESEAESEKTAPRGRENGSQVAKETAGSEESHVDVESESRQVEVGSAEPSRKSVTKEGKEVGGVAFSGHSSSDIMSAQLLLSLTDGHHKDWSGSSTVPPLPPSSELQTGMTESPTKSLLSKEASIVLTPVQLKPSGRDETASPASSTSQAGGRKRKQKPIASAKPGDEGIESTTPATKTSTPTPTPRGRRGGRKKKQTTEEDVVEEGRTTEPKSSAKKKQASEKDGTEKETPGRLKQLSPEELLVLLDIPPSTGKASSKTKTPVSKLKGKGKDKSSQDGRSVLQSSNATAKMEQLKASRAGKPMKEFVIETDSDSDSSSSGTSSSRFSPDSGSSSESSSDSSSDEGGEKDASEAKAKPPPKKVPARSLKGSVARGRGGRGRGGRAQRKEKKEASSSEGSSSEDATEETEESKKKPARGRGRATATRGGGRGGSRGGRAVRADTQQTTATKQGRGGHIVSIPTNLLSHKPTSGKKRKAVVREVSLLK